MALELTPNRQIVLDTETTGMNEFGAHYEGHCIIEIGAVEMINRRYTGRQLHFYIKPDRPVDPEAIKVHGITDEMLADKPDFSAIAQEFIDFIKGAELLIHNAPFDIGFMDYEFKKHNCNIKTADICLITDTLQMARQMYPGKRNSLDALCDRLHVDNSKRELHGALLDAEILGDVYLAMTGGQTSLFDEEEHKEEESVAVMAMEETIQQQVITDMHDFKLLLPNEEEKLAHEEYLQLLNKKSKENCLWIKRNIQDTVH
ncbi:DNA polymerase III subunit epsilon [Canicola haemoglobinophilus]|uniref:DNA polymerase III subunit epsilon n=1 Tax=Canicola haemoglobinophilus TaxID=733 RepID=A0A1V4AZ25_9PAST|nr:DNA polymerase III subunit epsilon [Canicola haemoglobinophilus]OOR98106.1 DNA polymerase III subunit epsilon [Canicola haemoglobinophilus]STO55526.1 DNA polymerase III subunit epsilon [Canicola haemoglobinophilus]STO58987.1 DNA polymerase III subunit epsilon [Canicola haemoglobinophilus]STO67853.1 DNA polymerase III subunit epsilon [Canicola haemoglobinophilus]